MEFKARIMVKIATGDAATTIIDGTMTIAIEPATTTGGGEFRGLTNRSGI
jgi:hypothetical protein